MKTFFFVIILFFTINLFADDKIQKYTELCDQGKSSYCLELGKFYFIGDGVEKDLLKSKKIFRDACKSRIAKGCYYLGFIYKRGGVGVKQNKKKAKLAFGRACNIGSEHACAQWRKLDKEGI